MGQAIKVAPVPYSNYILAQTVAQECKPCYNSNIIFPGVFSVPHSLFSFNAEGNIFRLKNREIFDGLAKPLIYQKEQILYQQGDDSDYVYYLKSGRIQIYVSSPDGSEKILAVFPAGCLFGKASFFDRMQRSSCAKALTRSEVVRIDKAMMMDLIGRYPAFAFELLEYLSKTIRMLSNQIENLSFLGADRRVARFIIENLSCEYVDYSHAEISAVVGVSRVTVSKILGRFAASGWIKTEYRSIRVLDIRALTEFAY